LPQPRVAVAAAAAAPAAPAAPAPAPQAGGPYEFSDAHKESFRALAASVSFVGACTLLFTVLTLIFGLGEIYMSLVPSGIAMVVASGINGVMAWWMVSAGRSLSAMVRTRGRDVELLMESVVHLRRLFGLWRVSIIVLALAITAGGAVVVWCTFVVERGGKCFGAFG
jgi:hypothetical protein